MVRERFRKFVAAGAVLIASAAFMAGMRSCAFRAEQNAWVDFVREHYPQVPEHCLDAVEKVRSKKAAMAATKGSVAMVFYEQAVEELDVCIKNAPQNAQLVSPDTTRFRGVGGHILGAALRFASRTPAPDESVPADVDQAASSVTASSMDTSNP